jgi:hypothetical protein
MSSTQGETSVGFGTTTSSVPGVSVASAAAASDADEPQAPSTVPLRLAESAERSAAQPSAAWSKSGRARNPASAGAARVAVVMTFSSTVAF